MVARKSKNKEVEYTYIAIKLDSFSCHINAGINYEIRDSRLANPNSKVFSFQSELELTGVCSYQDDRAGNQYKIDVFGHELNRGNFEAILSDYHVKDDEGIPKYRKRGKEKIPVYDPPDSIGYIEKRRGENLWCVYVWISPNSVSDMISLMGSKSPLYMSIDEVKVGRHRRVRSISFQTTDPAEE